MDDGLKIGMVFVGIGTLISSMFLLCMALPERQLRVLSGCARIFNGISDICEGVSNLASL